MDPDQTAPIGAVCSGSMLFASIINSSVMLGNYLQQTTFSDVVFFLDALRVNSLCEQVDSSFKFDTINLELSIVYSKGSLVIIPNGNVLLSLKIVFVLTNSVDPDKLTLNVALHLGLHCLPKRQSGVISLFLF